MCGPIRLGGCEMEDEVVGIDSRIIAPLKVHSYWYITLA